MEKPVIGPRWVRHKRTRSNQPAGLEGGWSLIELLVVVAIIVITTAVAVPLVQKATASYQLKSAADSVADLIQANRYRAISTGYEFEVVMTASTSKYQLESDPLNSTNCTGCAAVGNNGNLPGSGLLWGSGINATLGQSTTLLFRPSGMVQILSPGTTMPATITVSYGSLTPETITVTNYGYITVSP